MSAHLWKAYFEDDLERFRQLLANACYLAATPVRGGQGGKAGSTSTSGSPAVGLATSPNITSKSKKSHGWASSASSSWNGVSRPVTGITLTRGDINWRDTNGVTLLHQIASSANENASQYAFALLRVPMIDLFIQDNESGWTALHRALYFGNVTIARALISRDIQDTIAHSNLGAAHVTCGLIKIKDREGNSPFDVYGSSITTRVIRPISSIPLLSGQEDDEDDDMVCGAIADHEDNENDREVTPRINVGGDEIFTFGSNKNFTLGFGDEDDRQYPERISLKRPDHLLHRFQNEHQAQKSEAHVLKSAFGTPDPLPALIKYRPIVIQDVQLSKLHSAILTTDPEANLYICGFGPGGRLGTGDETTRFHFVCICGGALANKRVVHVALGQNHTVAISSHGEVFTWGSNAFGQLGYSPPSSNLNDEEPLQLLPRQVFGSVKRETVIGAAASRCHSVLHTANSLFTFGKNDGQLGLVDSDARSLVMQTTPRKVAASLFSSPVSLVSAIEKATICLLENHDVWIFANYGYTKMSFSLETFSSSRLKGSYSATKFSNTKNYIYKITSGGDTICAMSAEGDVFTITVSQKLQSDTTTASTTNPSKIRGALSSPQKVWSLRKDHMAVRDVAVGQDGSIMICTDSGSVWRRVKRAMIKDTDASRAAEYKPKDYKFSRVGGLTRVTAVRSSTFGAYAAVRKDCDVLKTQIEVDHHQIWKDLYPLLPFRELGLDEDSDTELPAPRFWTPSPSHNIIATIRRALVCSNDLEGQIMAVLKDQETSRRFTYDLRVTTTTSDVIIPVHEFILSGRSEIMRRSFIAFRQSYFLNIPEIMTIEYDKDGKILISFLAVDFVTLLNFVTYIYTDYFVDIWYNVKSAPESAVRFRQIRLELMKIASYLDLPRLEQAARVMNEPSKTLHKDMERAIQQPEYFDFGDVEIMLDGTSMKVHSDLICQRCPFFDGLFNGRADGLWLSSRREQVQEPHEAIRVDLKHVDAKVFRYVLRYLYADSGEEIFDDIVTADFDAFLDLILDIMSVANELMLDRLQQCCQKMLGRFGMFCIERSQALVDRISECSQCLPITQCRGSMFSHRIQRRIAGVYLSQP